MWSEVDCAAVALAGSEVAHWGWRAAALRQLPRHGQVPKLAMTANAYDEDREACLAAGMNDFNTKPMAPRRAPSWLLWRERPRKHLPKVAPQGETRVCSSLCD